MAEALPTAQETVPAAPVCCTFKTGEISDLTQIQLTFWQQELEKGMNVFSVMCGRDGWGKRRKMVSVLVPSGPE